MISDSQTLTEYMQSLTDGFCGMDLEADSLHRYGDRLCLIQFTDGEKHSLIDPLEIDDLTVLKNKLQAGEVWMHGADYDMTLMRKAWNALPETIFDTQIASRLVGAKRFGYANLVEDYLGVELDKGSQKADWAKRPLTEKMEEYALNDVIYLQPLAELLVKLLHEKGRYDWFVESCRDAQNKAAEREHEKVDPWRIKGCGRLCRKGLAYLKELWHWRDNEAREWDRPVFMVCGNKSLLEWVSDLVEGKVPRLPDHYRSSRVNRFVAATNRVKKLEPEEYPEKPKGERKKKDPEIEDRIEKLLKQKNAMADDLAIDSSIIASRTTIEAIVRGQVEAEEVLMSWQYDLLNDLLVEK